MLPVSSRKLLLRYGVERIKSMSAWKLLCSLGELVLKLLGRNVSGCFWCICMHELFGRILSVKHGSIGMHKLSSREYLRMFWAELNIEHLHCWDIFDRSIERLLKLRRGPVFSGRCIGMHLVLCWLVSRNHG